MTLRRRGLRHAAPAIPARALLVAASLIVTVPTALPHAAFAGVDDERREVERIVDELDRLGEQADILAEDYAVAVDQKNQLDVEVADAEARVSAKEAEVAAVRGDLSEVAVRAFTGAGTDVLGPLFSNVESYGDGLQREQYSRVALSVGSSTTDDLDELIRELDDERADLAAKRSEVEALTQRIQQQQAQVEELTAQYQTARADAEARLGAAIAAEEQRRAEAAYAKMQADYAAQQAAARSASGGGGSGGGGSGGGSGGGGSGGGGSSGGGAPAAPSVNVPSVSGMAGVAINAAMGQLGVAYRYATSNPGVSFDCSGLTHYAWGQAGVYLPRNSRAQAAALPNVPPAAAQPGDLIFFYSPISHVGIYLGGGMMVHAPNSGTVVKSSPVSWGKVTAVGRPG